MQGSADFCPSVRVLTRYANAAAEFWNMGTLSLVFCCVRTEPTSGYVYKKMIFYYKAMIPNFMIPRFTEGRNTLGMRRARERESMPGRERQSGWARYIIWNTGFHRNTTIWACGLVVESTLRMWPESVFFLKSLMSTSGKRKFISSSAGARTF
jgi:hypothetical protein